MNRSKARRVWLRWERHLNRYGIVVPRNGAYRNVPGPQHGLRVGGLSKMRAWHAYVDAELPRWERQEHRRLWRLP